VRDVSIQRDKGRLSVLQITPENSDSTRIAVLGHPVSRRGKYFFANEIRLAPYIRNGYEIFVFDFNGFGESDTIDFNFSLDTRAVITSVIGNRRFRSFVFHGVSFGAYHAICALDCLPKGSNVILENIPRSEGDYLRRSWALASLAKTLTFLGSKAFVGSTVKEALQSLDRRDLSMNIVLCENDTVAPAAEARDLLRSYHAGVNWLTFANAGHLQAAELYPERYMAQIAACLQ
jgi:alpha/beta superfamily hydrolase